MRTLNRVYEVGSLAGAWNLHHNITQSASPGCWLKKYGLNALKHDADDIDRHYPLQRQCGTCLS